MRVQRLRPVQRRQCAGDEHERRRAHRRQRYAAEPGERGEHHERDRRPHVEAEVVEGEAEVLPAVRPQVRRRRDEHAEQRHRHGERSAAAPARDRQRE
jgi:hypothetical protein